MWGSNSWLWDQESCALPTESARHHDNFYFKMEYELLLKVLLKCKYLKRHLNDILYKHVQNTVDTAQFK